MLVPVLAFLLVASLGTLVYSYVGYPLLLVVLARFVDAPSPDRYGPNDWPPVTMVVPVHNEAEIVEEKVKNVISTHYPGSFRCLFVSDSTDDTDSRIRQAAQEREDIALISLDERRGKSYAINRALDRIDEGVVVFSDANTMYEPDAVTELVAPLVDERVGATTGRLHLEDPEGQSAEGVYWRYELWLRRLEAQLGTTVGANGGLLAARRADLDLLPERALVDDLVMVLRTLRAGRRVHYVADAVATERVAEDLAAEYTRRVRIGAGNYQALVWFADLLAPWRGRVALEFGSHKVLRWLGPWLLGTAGMAALALVVLAPSLITGAIVGAGLVILGLATVGFLSKRANHLPIVRIPAYFVAMNAALAVGAWRAFQGAGPAVWTVTERTE